MEPMPCARANGIELEYETLGDPHDPALLLITGLGAQMVSCDLPFLESFVDRGFFAIRFDNRDAGLSTKTAPAHHVVRKVMAAYAGDAIEAPYTLTEMADDAAAVLDAAGVGQTHLVGACLGGAIAQTLAIRHPDRVLSLTSIMATTGDPDVGQPDTDMLPVLLQGPSSSRAEAI